MVTKLFAILCEILLLNDLHYIYLREPFIQEQFKTGGSIQIIVNQNEKWKADWFSYESQTAS